MKRKKDCGFVPATKSKVLLFLCNNKMQKRAAIKQYLMLKCLQTANIVDQPNTKTTGPAR